MKRSEFNALVARATACFEAHGWALPPEPRWDVTDFGLRDWKSHGLLLVNLAEEPEYCEKLMYAERGMTTPAHCHAIKKEDIICRWGLLRVQVWPDIPGASEAEMAVKVNGQVRSVQAGEDIDLAAGERITLVPGVYHAFVPLSDQCIIGEVSTANDDVRDNIFANPEIGRFPHLEEDVASSK